MRACEREHWRIQRALKGSQRSPCTSRFDRIGSNIHLYTRLLQASDLPGTKTLSKRLLQAGCAVAFAGLATQSGCHLQGKHRHLEPTSDTCGDCSGEVWSDLSCAVAPGPARSSTVPGLNYSAPRAARRSVKVRYIYSAQLGTAGLMQDPECAEVNTVPAADQCEFVKRWCAETEAGMGSLAALQLQRSMHLSALLSPAAQAWLCRGAQMP